MMGRLEKMTPTPPLNVAIFGIYLKFLGCTLPETDSYLAPENGCLVQMIHSFCGKWPIFRAFAVSFREGIYT